MKNYKSRAERDEAKGMNKKENIVLIGFMGCGKTSVGIRLSYYLRRTFLDTDGQIEKSQDCSISKIFAEKGEAYFRDLETKQLELLVATADGEIISTGGGVPLRDENRRLLKQLGVVIYLKISPQVVYERLKNDTTRPLLQGEHPLEKIENMLKQRESFYRKSADVIINVDHLNIDEIVEKIARYSDNNRKKEM